MERRGFHIQGQLRDCEDHMIYDHGIHGKGRERAPLLLEYRCVVTVTLGCACNTCYGLLNVIDGRMRIMASLMRHAHTY